MNYLKFEKIFLITVAILQLLFFIYAVCCGNIYVGDYFEYLKQAENIKEYGNWYTSEITNNIIPDFYSRRPPLYPLFIFLVKSFINNNLAVIFGQSVLSFFIFFGLTRLFRQFHFNINPYKYLLAIIIFSPSQFIYSNVIMSEILFQTMIFWAFFYFVKFIKKPSSGYFFLNNLFIALAILTKPVFYLFWIFCILYSIYFFIKYKKGISIFAAGVIPLATVLFISSYNYKITGYFHYSSLKHNNIFDFNAYYVISNKYGYDSSRKFVETNTENLNEIKDYKNRAEEKERIGMDVIQDNLSYYIPFHVTGMLNLFLDPGRFDFIHFFKIEHEVQESLYQLFLNEGYKGAIKYFLTIPLPLLIILISVLAINLLLIATVVNLFITKRIKPEIKIYFFLIIFTITFFTGIVGAMRYKLPFFPLLLFAIPFLFEKLMKK